MVHVWHLAIIDELYKSQSSNHDHSITSSAGVSAPHVHVPVSHAPVSDALSPCASAHCALALYVPVQCAAFPSHWNVCNLLFTRPNTRQHFKWMALDTGAHIPWHWIPLHTYHGTRYQWTYSVALYTTALAQILFSSTVSPLRVQSIMCKGFNTTQKIRKFMSSKTNQLRTVCCT